MAPGKLLHVYTETGTDRTSIITSFQVCSSFVGDAGRQGPFSPAVWGGSTAQQTLASRFPFHGPETQRPDSAATPRATRLLSPLLALWQGEPHGSLFFSSKHGTLRWGSLALASGRPVHNARVCSVHLVLPAWSWSEFEALCLEFCSLQAAPWTLASRAEVCTSGGGHLSSPGGTVSLPHPIHAQWSALILRAVLAPCCGTDTSSGASPCPQDTKGWTAMLPRASLPSWPLEFSFC